MGKSGNQVAPCPATSVNGKRNTVNAQDETIQKVQSQSLHTVMAGQKQGKVEAFYYDTGVWIAQHDKEVIGVGILLLLIGCSFWQFAEIETDVGDLLIASDGRVREQLNYVDAHGVDGGDSINAVFATTMIDGGEVRNKAALMEHLEVAKSIHEIVVEYEGEEFTIFDVGEFPGAANGQPLRISPLDCFQEGDYDWTRVHSEQYKFATIKKDVPSYHDPDFHGLSSYSNLIGLLVGAPDTILSAYNGCFFLKVAQVFGYDFTESYLGRCRKFLNSPLTTDAELLAGMEPTSMDALQAFFKGPAYGWDENGALTKAEHDLRLQKNNNINYDDLNDRARTHNFCTCKNEWPLDGYDSPRSGCDGHIDFKDKRRPIGATQLSQSYSVLEKQFWCYIEEDSVCGNEGLTAEEGRWDTCTPWAWDLADFVATDEEVLDTLNHVQCGAWDGGVTGFNTIPWVREVVVGTSLEKDDRTAIQTIYFLEDTAKLLKRWQKPRENLHLGPDFGRSYFGIESSSGGGCVSSGCLMEHKSMILDMFAMEVTSESSEKPFRFLDVSNQFLEASDYLMQPWIVTPLDCFQEGGTSAAMVPPSTRRILGMEGAKQAITDILRPSDPLDEDTFEVHLTAYNWCVFSAVLSEVAKADEGLKAYKDGLVASEVDTDEDASRYMRWLDGNGDGDITPDEAAKSYRMLTTNGAKSTDWWASGQECRPFLFDPAAEDNGDVQSAVSWRAYRALEIYLNDAERFADVVVLADSVAAAEKFGYLDPNDEEKLHPDPVAARLESGSCLHWDAQKFGYPTVPPAEGGKLVTYVPTANPAGSSTNQFNSLQGRWRAKNYWETLKAKGGNVSQVPIAVYGREESLTLEEIAVVLSDFRNGVRQLATRESGEVSHSWVGTPEYTLEDVETVRQMWADEFITQADVKKELTRTVGFEPNQLTVAIQNASNASTTLTIIGYLIMIVYSSMELWPRPLVGIIGVFFVSLATGCGLGICAICGVTFNATSTKVLPFLLLGLGVDDMFVLAMNYKWTNQKRPAYELSGQLLGVWGPSITNTSFANLIVFLIGATAPLPMVVNFCTMASTSIFVIFTVNFFMTTALLSIQFRYSKSKKEKNPGNPLTQSAWKTDQILQEEMPARDGYLHEAVDVYFLPAILSLPGKIFTLVMMVVAVALSVMGYLNLMQGLPLTDIVPKDTSLFTFIEVNEEFFSIYSTSLYTEHQDYPHLQLELLDLHARVGETDYAVAATHWLEGFLDWSKPCTKDFLFSVPPCVNPTSDACTACDISAGVDELWNKVTNGESANCCLQEGTICFPYIHGVTSGSVLKYRQNACQADGAGYCRTDFSNACQMLANVGSPEVGAAKYGEFYNGRCDPENLLTLGKCGPLMSTRCIAKELKDISCSSDICFNPELVHLSRLLMPPDNFYFCFDNWIETDLGSTVLATNLPKDPEIVELPLLEGPGAFKVEKGYWWDVTESKSGSTIFGHRKFANREWSGNEPDYSDDWRIISSSIWTTRLSETEDYLTLIEQVRGETDKSFDQTPAFPMGTPFVFWEQYVTLDSLTAQNVALSLCALFVVSVLNFTVVQPPHLTIVQSLSVAMRCALIMCVSVLIVIILVAGSLDITGIRLNSISMLSLLTTVGIGNEFTSHIVLSFMAASGSNDLRVEEAIHHMFMPLVGGFISTFVGVVIMAFSPFLFVTKYFFALFMYILVYSLINAMFFLPVLLAVFGPKHDFEAKPHLKTNARMSIISIRNNADLAKSVTERRTELSSRRRISVAKKPSSGSPISKRVPSQTSLKAVAESPTVVAKPL